MDITRACRDISELSPLAQKAINLFLAECGKQGLNVLVTETYRPQERQNYLYEQGRTRPGSIVTSTKSSIHTKRNAWDICKNVKGQEYSDDLFFKKCGAIAKGLGIEWGGTWTSFVDKPHFQINTSWKEPVKQDDQYINAVDTMVVKGVISSPDIWKNETYTNDNVKSLIIKIAAKL